MGLLDRFFERQLDKLAPTVTDRVTQNVIEHVDNSFSKANDPTAAYLPTTGLKRYEFNQQNVNGSMQTRKKPGSSIAFETLRKFSVSHEITRACINLRKRQIVNLDWQITSVDPSDTNTYDTDIKTLHDFFYTIGGRGNNYRKFMDKFIEDIMVLDAVALEKQRTRNAGLHTLVPIDASTIRLLVDESGATPEAPEIAYKQVIRGTVTAELTTDDMIYEMMNPRNDSPYGLAPLESLIIIVTSSLKSGMYNLGYLTDGNIPEGLFTMPDSWQPQQIKDFQEYFDALMAGDEAMTRRIKFMPPGQYNATKKPNDMAFEQFNDWLMKITCALFEVTPMEIGFNPKSGLGGTGYSEQQGETAKNKGILPMANFIEEIFTHVIQEEMGYKHLQFEYTGLLEKDEKDIAETNEILIRSGQRTVNELRTDEGLDPIAGMDKPFFAGQITFLDEESQNAKADQIALSNQLPTAIPEPKKDDKATKDEPVKSKDVTGTNKELNHVSLVTELRTFRKYAIARKKADKSIRKFESTVLPENVVTELNSEVQRAKDIEEVKNIFKEYMSDYNVTFLADVQKVRNELESVL